MDKGIEFAKQQIGRALELSFEAPELKHLTGKIRKVYNRILNTSLTGDLLGYVEKFRNEDHRDTEEFRVFKKYNITSLEEMYNYIVKHYPDEIGNTSSIKDLKLGKKYSNYDLMNYFLCSEQGGMRRSKRRNALVIVSDHTKPLYDDKWKKGVLHYTGMGKNGNQSLNFSQNRTVHESNVNKVVLYLFEVYNPGVLNKYEYKGIVKLVGKPYKQSQFDEEGSLRDVWMFPLKPVDKSLTRLTDLKKAEEISEKEARRLSDKEIIETIRTKNLNIASESYAVTKVVHRDALVKELTKRRAKGYCDLCGEPAPFVTKKGEPFLEVHHIITLSNKGPDKITNTVALCPNCHRKIHYANSIDDEKFLVKVILNNLLDETDLYIEAQEMFKKRKLH